MSRFIGNVSAYAYAVSQGYTGTEEEYAELMASYATVAEEAAESAESASQSATQAGASAQTATTKASEASQSATQAGTKANQASTSATQAGASATSASQSAQTATTKASEASASASTASTKASEASTSASTASSKASEASASATAASESEANASASATAAAQSASDAADSASDAQTAAANAHIEKAFPTDTASGAVATFTDGADDIPMKSVKVALEPAQDLHGYDHPWPGGGGKNLLPYAAIESPLTINGITFAKSQDGSIAINGTSTKSFAQTFVEVALQPGNYYFNCGNGFSIQSNTYLYIMDLDNSRTLAEINANNIGRDVAFSIDAQTNIRFYMVVGDADSVISGTIYPMIRLSSVTDATFAPYSNICPISGWTGAQVVRTGKNLFDIEEYFKRENTNYEKDGDSFTFTPKQSMYNNPWRFAKKDSVISASVQSLTNITTSGIKLRFLDDSGTTVFTLDESTNSVKNIVASSVRADWNISGLAKIIAPQIEFGAENTSYEPYTGDTYSITFPSEAGTVYGGELDVTSGVLTMDRAIIASYNGETLPSEWISDRDKYVAGTTPTTGAQVCYKLSQAVVYTLTPTEIKSLLGDNNIWADAGDTEVTYRADTAMYIDKKIAEVINALS